MKKKILLLLLLLIPFMVKANDIDNLKLKWVVEDDNLYKGSYNTTNAFIEFTEDSITSIDKYTGARKEVVISDNSPHLMLDDKIFVFNSGVYGSIKYIVYDEHLERLNKVNTELDGINYITIYDDNYILLSGFKYENGTDYLVILFIDKDGNITKTDQLNTINTVGAYRRNDELIYSDSNFNFYKIENYKIVPSNINSDGTRMYLTDDKLYKVSNTGDILDSVDIPNGRNTRIAKKGDYYYLATGVYEEFEQNKYHVGLKIYKIDEELNIVATEDIAAPNCIFNSSYLSADSSYSYHGIFNDNGVLYAYIETNYNNQYSYNISDDLEITTGNRHAPIGKNNYSRSINGFYKFSLHTMEENYEGNDLFSLSDDEEISIRNALKDEENYKNFKAIKYNNGYLVLEYFERCEGTGCSSIYSYTNPMFREGKVDLVYLDSNFNIVKRKNIYDWETLLDFHSPDNPENKYYKYLNAAITPYGEYFILFGSASSKNILYIMDKDWNIVKDFSKDIEKYEYLGTEDLLITEKGFYVALENQNRYELTLKEGATATIKNGFVKGEVLPAAYIPDVIPLAGTNTTILYYSINYNIDKNITGKGTITSTVEKADEGEVVRFTVTPEEGYVLSVVKVTDANGNVLTFTNNTFVMPSADVIIEATFVPKNPKTSDIAILVICLIALSSFVIFALEKRRLNTLK